MIRIISHNKCISENLTKPKNFYKHNNNNRKTKDESTKTIQLTFRNKELVMDRQDKTRQNTQCIPIKEKSHMY